MRRAWTNRARGLVGGDRCGRKHSEGCCLDVSRSQPRWRTRYTKHTVSDLLSSEITLTLTLGIQARNAAVKETSKKSRWLRTTAPAAAAPTHVAGVAGLIGAGCSSVDSCDDATTEDAGEALPQKSPRGPFLGRLPSREASSPWQKDGGQTRKTKTTRRNRMSTESLLTDRSWEAETTLQQYSYLSSRRARVLTLHTFLTAAYSRVDERKDGGLASGSKTL